MDSFLFFYNDDVPEGSLELFRGQNDEFVDP